MFLWSEVLWIWWACTCISYLWYCCVEGHHSRPTTEHDYFLSFGWWFLWRRKATVAGALGTLLLLGSHGATKAPVGVYNLNHTALTNWAEKTLPNQDDASWIMKHVMSQNVIDSDGYILMAETTLTNMKMDTSMFVANCSKTNKAISLVLTDWPENGHGHHFHTHVGDWVYWVELEGVELSPWGHFSWFLSCSGAQFSCDDAMRTNRTWQYMAQLCWGL